MWHAGVDTALNLAERFGNEAASFGRVQLRSIEAAGIVEIERLLLEYYEIPLEYFTDKYGVTIDRPREAKTRFRRTVVDGHSLI